MAGLCKAILAPLRPFQAGWLDCHGEQAREVAQGRGGAKGQKFLGARAEGTLAFLSAHLPSPGRKGGGLAQVQLALRKDSSWGPTRAPFPLLLPPKGKVIRTPENQGPQSSPGSPLIEETDLSQAQAMWHVLREGKQAQRGTGRCQDQ